MNMANLLILKNMSMCVSEILIVEYQFSPFLSLSLSRTSVTFSLALYSLSGGSEDDETVFIQLSVFYTRLEKNNSFCFVSCV